MGAAHAAADKDVIAQHLSCTVADRHNAQVIGEQVHAVVAGHGDRDLELAGQEMGAVDGLRRIGVIGAKAVEIARHCHCWVLQRRWECQEGQGYLLVSCVLLQRSTGLVHSHPAMIQQDITLRSTEAPSVYIPRPSGQVCLAAGMLLVQPETGL